MLRSISTVFVKIGVVSLDSIIVFKIKHSQIMIGGNKHILTITGKAVNGGASIMLTRTSRKIQLNVSAGHTNIVEVNTTMVFGTAQYRIETVVLKTVKRRVERILPN